MSTHDVFVSHSSKDADVAKAVCHALESDKVRCWVAPRDIHAGESWGGAIVNAIADARVMVLIYSRDANLSKQVLREVERAVAKDVPILPFRLCNTPMSKDLEYFLSAPHWLDAIDGPTEAHLQKLKATVARLLDPPAPADARSRSTSAHDAAPRRGGPGRPVWLAGGALALVAVLAVALIVWGGGQEDPGPSAPNLPSSAGLTTPPDPAQPDNTPGADDAPIDTPPAEPPAPPLSEADQRVADALQNAVPVDFPLTPLGEALEYLSLALGVNIEHAPADERWLEVHMVKYTPEFPLPAAQTLATILDDAGFAYTIRNGAVWVQRVAREPVDIEAALAAPFPGVFFLNGAPLRGVIEVWQERTHVAIDVDPDVAQRVLHARMLQKPTGERFDELMASTLAPFGLGYEVEPDRLVIVRRENPDDRWARFVLDECEMFAGRSTTLGDVVKELETEYDVITGVHPAAEQKWAALQTAKAELFPGGPTKIGVVLQKLLGDALTAEPMGGDLVIRTPGEAGG